MTLTLLCNTETLKATRPEMIGNSIVLMVAVAVVGF